MNRQQREHVAHETVAILNTGAYSLPNESVVNLQAALEVACTGTTLYAPGDYQMLLTQVADQGINYSTTIGVSNQTTLEAAHSLLETYSNVTALNFASAKNPGGGFLSGSQAQEESLARSSGLYMTLQTQPQFYDYHRHQKTSLYSDHLIFSPQVPIFRDEGSRLLDTPFNVNFITAAAVNAGALRQNEPTEVINIASAMERRARMVLAVAALHESEALVLGAWGCGVFQNDPTAIATIFASALSEPNFQERFAHVEFAIYDSSPSQATFKAFKQIFDS